ncbi:MAG: TIGR02281 family clan AA aspartic protease [Halofilum sp. (in: g-proteobacteria)]|nr:TIGR02281 family clan AA aspartic protease [Halofilum sp. (in: g-proteobacteria)]
MSDGVRALAPIALTFAVLMAALYWALGGLVERRQHPNQGLESGAGGPQRVELVANAAGQYIVPGRINGTEVDFLVDTGASHVAVPEDIAREIGLRRGPEIRVQTASGTARAYHTTIDRIAVGGIVRRDVRGSINPSMPGDYVLLGMTYLRDLELRQTGDRLILEAP